MNKNFVLGVLFLIALISFMACTDNSDGTNPTEQKIVSAITVEGYKKNFKLGEEFSLGDEFSILAEYTDGTAGILEPERYTVDDIMFYAQSEDDYIISVTVNSTSLQPEVNTRYTVSVRSPILKILSIGNSFSVDAHAYLYKIIQASGFYEDVIVAGLAIPAGTFQAHYDNILADEAVYGYNKESFSGKISKSSYAISKALVEEEWDIITVQQVSHYSGLLVFPESMLRYVGKYLKENCTNSNVKILWHGTWAYQANSTHGGFNNYDRNQLTMYNAIVNILQTVIEKSEVIDGIISNSTAIQNARTSRLGDNLTVDGSHLSLGQGRFIAGLMFFKVVSKGLDLKFIENIDIQNMFGNQADKIDVEFLKIAIESVENAYLSPFEVTQSVF